MYYCSVFLVIIVDFKITINQFLHTFFDLIHIKIANFLECMFFVEVLFDKYVKAYSIFENSIFKNHNNSKLIINQSFFYEYFFLI